MITKEQVADLRHGDVVRITEIYADGSRFIHEGPVRADGGNALCFGDLWLRSEEGDPPAWVETLTVVSRAPRLYVNHDRTEPVPGDVVRAADGDDAGIWVTEDETINRWWGPLGPDYSPRWNARKDLPARLRLLVDGETGQAVTA